MKSIFIVLLLFMALLLGCGQHTTTPTEPQNPDNPGKAGTGIWVTFTGADVDKQGVYKYSTDGTEMVFYPCQKAYEVKANSASTDVWCKITSTDGVDQYIRLSDVGIAQAAYPFPDGLLYKPGSVNETSGELWGSKESAQTGMSSVYRIAVDGSLIRQSNQTYQLPLSQALCYYPTNQCWVYNPTFTTLYLMDQDFNVQQTVTNLWNADIALDQRNGDCWVQTGYVSYGPPQMLLKYDLNGQLVLGKALADVWYIQQDKASGALYCVGGNSTLTKYDEAGNQIWSVSIPAVIPNTHAVDCASDGSIWISYNESRKILHYSAASDYLGELLLPYQIESFAVRE